MGDIILTTLNQVQDMVITVPAQKQSFRGIRPINLNKDIPQVLRLLEKVFGKSLGPESRSLLMSGRASGGEPAFLWRFTPAASSLAKGFVWEEHGRIIGNATVLRTRTQGRFLVVNVGVHPEFRRQGIARDLMEAVIDMAQSRRGNEIVLQVVKDNLPAVNLYNRLQFETLGSLTTWFCSMTRLQEIARSKTGAGIHLREQAAKEWREAFELDQTSFQPALQWPEPLAQDTYQKGGWRRLRSFLSGNASETWVTTSEKGRLTGLVRIESQWGHPHKLSLRVRPDWRGELERPLLAKAVRRLFYFPHRNIRIEHPYEDEAVNRLLREANFTARRTLTTMRLNLRT